jgi:thiosulfate dehydrogenase (quinone) large subunit
MPARKTSANGANWFRKNARAFTRFVEIAFGLVWLYDAVFKFTPFFIENASALISEVAVGQPAFLQPWFQFWIAATSFNPTAFAYSIAFLELAIAIALIFGLLRKMAFFGGFVYSMMLWAVAEGFGGPIGPETIDIDAGIVYALVFLALIALNSVYENNAYTIDAFIEKKLKWWASFAEM